MELRLNEFNLHVANIYAQDHNGNLKMPCLNKVLIIEEFPTTHLIRYTSCRYDKEMHKL